VHHGTVRCGSDLTCARPVGAELKVNTFLPLRIARDQPRSTSLLHSKFAVHLVRRIDLGTAPELLLTVSDDIRTKPPRNQTTLPTRPLYAEDRVERSEAIALRASNRPKPHDTLAIPRLFSLYRSDLGHGKQLSVI